MSFTPIPNGIRVVHLGHVGTIEIVNTIGCQNGVDGAMGDDMDSLAQHHGDAWRAHIVPLLGSWYEHTETLAYSLEDESLAPGNATFSGAQAGGYTNTMAPLGTCMVVAFKTAKRGRTYQGRTFISPLPTTWVNGDSHSWTTDAVATMQTAMAAYKDAVDPALNGNGRLAVNSKGSPTHGIAPHSEPVTSILVRSNMGSQRRRLS
jgi:hypothetical protein